MDQAIGLIDKSKLKPKEEPKQQSAINILPPHNRYWQCLELQMLNF